MLYGTNLYICIFVRYVLMIEMSLCARSNFSSRWTISSRKKKMCEQIRVVCCLLHFVCSRLICEFDVVAAAVDVLIAIQVWLIKRVFNVCWHFFFSLSVFRYSRVFTNVLQSIVQGLSSFSSFSRFLLVNCRWTLIFWPILLIIPWSRIHFVIIIWVFVSLPALVLSQSRSIDV